MVELEVIFSLFALVIAALAFYYSHLLGPKIEIYFKRKKGQKSDKFAYEILGDDHQHAKLDAHIYVMLVNEGNRTGTIIPHEAPGSEYIYFVIKQEPEIGSVRIAIERLEEDIKTILAPGENTVFRLVVEGIRNKRIHHGEADGLLGKEIKVEFSFISTTRRGFQTKKKAFRLTAVDKRDLGENK